MKTIEHRAMRGLEVRAAEEGSEHIGILTGYAAVFDSDSQEFSGWEKPWVERIAPGAFARSLTDQPDVKALWSHRDDAILARSPDTLSLQEDETGLRVDIRLIDTQQNRDVLASVKGGLVDAMSFGFQARKVTWEEGEERETRTLLDVDLYEVSPVVWPAYPATSISTKRSARAMEASKDELSALREERDAYFKAATLASENNQAELRVWEQRLRFLSLAPALSTES